MHFISVYSLLSVCVCVCVCVCVQGRPCVCEVEWRGLSFQCDSEEGWGRERELERCLNSVLLKWEKKQIAEISYIFKKSFLQKLQNYLHAGKKSFWGSMVSFMTLQNSMDERK